MKKQRLDLEFPLATKSPKIVWELISTPHGLERWIANHVSEADGAYTFTWGELWTEHDTKTSQLVEYVKNDHIRLKWEEDDDEEPFWEMRIGQSELTGELSLLVTDYALPEEMDDLRGIWDDNLERLHHSTGL